MKHKIANRTEITYNPESASKLISKFANSSGSVWDTYADSATTAVFVKQYKKEIHGAKIRGVRIRFLTNITKANIHYCKELMKIVGELRHLDGVKGHFSVSDSDYLTTVTSQDEKPILQLIYSNVKNMVEQHQYLFETLWSKSIDGEQRVKEIEEGMKPEYFEVFTDRDRELVGQILLDLAKSVKKEALILLPNDKALLRVDRLGFIDHIIRASREGASVKMICPLSDENSESVKRIHEYAPAITILDADNSLYGLYIFDGEKFLRAELKEVNADKFSDAIGFTVYSNSRVGVDSLRSVFELLWKQHKLNEELKRADQMQQEFINIASHEMKTPIQAILGYSKLIQRHPEQREHIIQVIFRNAIRLQRLTSDILDVSLIEGKALKLNLERLNLDQLISDIAEDYRNEIEKSDSHIKLVHKVQNEDIQVEGDKNRLTQVISNLISNAVKFTREGSIIIKAEINDGKALVSVKDTGQGIDPEILPRLFMKFATKSDKGTGLGLFISKNIIEAHGGKIWAERNESSGAKNGATFIFSIPLAS